MTTGLAGGTEAAGAAGTVRAALPGWPSRSPGSALSQDSSQPVQSSSCSEDRVVWVGGRGCSPFSHGQCWGTAAALLGDFYFTQSLKNPWIQD